MAKYIPKPYKKLCKLTKQWVWVYPEPREFRKDLKQIFKYSNQPTLNK